MYAHISYSTTDDCINWDSYGCICVKCNCCGRFDKNTKNEALLEHYKDMLQRQYDFDRWHEDKDIRENQEKNVKSNIEYFKKKIKQTKWKMEKLK